MAWEVNHGFTAEELTRRDITETFFWFPLVCSSFFLDCRQWKRLWERWRDPGPGRGTCLQRREGRRVEESDLTLDKT